MGTMNLVWHGLAIFERYLRIFASRKPDLRDIWSDAFRYVRLKRDFDAQLWHRSAAKWHARQKFIEASSIAEEEYDHPYYRIH